MLQRGPGKYFSASFLTFLQSPFLLNIGQFSVQFSLHIWATFQGQRSEADLFAKKKLKVVFTVIRGNAQGLFLTRNHFNMKHPHKKGMGGPGGDPALQKKKESLILAIAFEKMVPP